MKKIILRNTMLLLLFLVLNAWTFAQELVNDALPEVLSTDCPASEEICSGKIVWDDGSHYTGEFRHGKIHGKGKLVFEDGTSYEGDFIDEVFHGQGTMVYEDGSKYIGGWVSGYREGEGNLIFSDGSEYMGTFEMDQFHGQGAIYLETGASYSGDWEYGQMNGFGVITRLDGSQYIGMSESGNRHGSGMVVFESGDTLHGNWVSGKMEDEGFFQFADGSTLIGTWENGLMKNENTYIDPEGERYMASTEEIVERVLQKNLLDSENIERNFGMAFYAVGMEYKSINEYDRARQNLEYAAQLSSELEGNFIKEMTDIQLANIKMDEDKASGTANLKDDEKDN